MCGCDTGVSLILAFTNKDYGMKLLKEINAFWNIVSNCCLFEFSQWPLLLHTVQEIQPRLDELIRQWKELEETTAAKGEKLFDANRHVLYEQSCDDIDGWINEIESQIITDDLGHDLTTVNLLVQKQNVCT